MLSPDITPMVACHDLDRALYLLAAAISLRHGTLADAPGLPCATVTVVDR